MRPRTYRSAAAGRTPAYALQSTSRNHMVSCHHDWRRTSLHEPSVRSPGRAASHRSSSPRRAVSGGDERSWILVVRLQPSCDQRTSAQRCAWPRDRSAASQEASSRRHAICIAPYPTPCGQRQRYHAIGDMCRVTAGRVCVPPCSCRRGTSPLPHRRGRAARRQQQCGSARTPGSSDVARPSRPCRRRNPSQRAHGWWRRREEERGPSGDPALGPTPPPA